MYLWLCERRQFVDFIVKRNPPNINEIKITDTVNNLLLHGDKLLLVWQNSPTEIFSLPRVIFVAEDNLSDFLAWVSTYFRNIRPFTAHCRLLTPSLAPITTHLPPISSLCDIRYTDIGLILAEGITYSVGRTDLNRLPFSAFARTLSYAYAESLKQYGHNFTKNIAFTPIKNGWQKVREISNQSPLHLSPADISDVWAVVLNALANNNIDKNEIKSDPVLVEAIRGVKANGHIPQEIWVKFSNLLQKKESLIDAMEGPREGRVKAVEKAIQELENGSEETRKHRAFIAGYLASLIQPGSLDHFSVLFQVIAKLRECFLWYGVCSGLTPDSTVGNYGNGLGWLMKRELGRHSHWLDRPSCDIALKEMEILFQNRDNAKVNLRILENGILKVEVFPLIYTTVKWSEYGESQVVERNIPNSNSNMLFDEGAKMRQIVLELLHKIEENSFSLEAIRKQVERTFGEKTPKTNKRRK